MKTASLSKHAIIRSQQRGIPPLVIEWLLDYGYRQPARGATRITFNRKSRKALSKEVGKVLLAHLGRFLNVALIVNTETDHVITVEWLH